MEYQKKVVVYIDILGFKETNKESSTNYDMPLHSDMFIK